MAMRAALDSCRRKAWRVIPALALAALACEADMAVRVDEATQRYTICDGGAPVLTYNFGSVPVPAGVSGKYAVARSDYVHPLFGPNGEVLTRDYSPDHPHHRGIYWAWPEVTYKGETRDLHALQGVFERPVRIVSRKANAEGAELVAENLWKWGDQEPIVREFATIRVSPARDGIRPIDFHFRFEALVEGVTLARRQKSHYGGFNVRLSAREAQAIDKHVATNAVPWPEAWAELRGVPPGSKEAVGILILQSPVNPGYPGDWIDYPELNWLQPTFPAAGTAYPLNVGDPLTLNFRVLVRNGPGLAVPPATLFSEYTAGIPCLPEALAAYKAGDDRRALTRFEVQLRAVKGRGGLTSGEEPFEQRLLTLLAMPSASGDFKRWACSQLVIAGSDACIPTVAPILGDDVAWMQAADVLLSRPGDAGLAALRAALPALPASRRASVCHLLGVRRDPRAVSILTAQAAAAESDVARAAVSALGAIGTPGAADALLTLTVADPVRDALWDARLLVADRLSAGPSGKAAIGLYDQVWYDAAAKPWHRAGALCGLARVASSAAAPRVAWALASEDVYLRSGAASALCALGDSDLAAFRKSFGEAPAGVRLALLEAWSARGLRSAEPEALASLADEDPGVRLAAVRALRSIGTAAAVGPLLSIAAAGGVPGKEADSVLAQLNGSGVENALRRATRDANEERAAAATSLVGARRGRGYAETLLAAVEDGRPACAREALIVLRNEGLPAHLTALRRCLVASNTVDRAGLAKVMVAICKRANEPGPCLYSALAGKPPIEGPARDAMLSALPAIGGPVALTFVTLTRDEASVRALINWPDDAAAAPLLAVAQRDDVDPSLRALAAAGFVQFAKRVLPVARQAEELAKVMSHLPDEAARAELTKYLETLK
jgi:HEAT repeat protein